MASVHQKSRNVPHPTHVPRPASPELISALEQTLYREARLLDQERYDEWVEMLAEDIH